MVFNKMKEENWGVILPLLPAKMGVSLGGRDCGRLSMESIQTQAITFEFFLKRDSLGKTAGRSLRSGWLMLAESSEGSFGGIRNSPECGKLTVKNPTWSK